MPAIDVTTQTFDEVVRHAEHPVLVEFWAEWCGPCKRLLPEIHRIADDYAGRITVALVNADEERALASAMTILSLPAVYLFVDGKATELRKHKPAALRAAIDEALGA
ncbi:MAG: thioredoxin domain-containing protein [Bifidobacterium sp.]|nr:thioredoxin domain-containing protein [Bifidobacterium sp.]